MSQYAFYVNSNRCITCKACGMACKDKNDLEPGRKYRRIHSMSTGAWSRDASGIYVPKDVFSYSVSLACNHCAQPACVAACPVGAMQKDDATGIVDNDKAVCIGCGSCSTACPYNAPSLDKAAQKTGKCDFCKDLLEQGQPPACVAACSAQALDFGELADIKAAHADAVQQVAPLADPGMTTPSLFITPRRGYSDGIKATSFNLPEELQACEG
jgi:anaerobic dimethyl sulfoxide reductase subunit B (iron-sulfur subunit)